MPDKQSASTRSLVPDEKEKPPKSPEKEKKRVKTKKSTTVKIGQEA